MKKIYFIVLLFYNFSGFAQYTLIPDANFEKALIDAGIDNGTIDGKVLTTNVSGIISLDLSNKSITNLAGIQDFLSLTNLSCFNNQLTSLDVTKNTSLTYLSCWSNQLSNLDVTKNTSLTYLDCNNNKLTSLNVTQNTTLNSLYCNYNQLTDLDVTKNIGLNHLACSSNKLTSLEITINTSLNYLSCFSNQLTTLDVTKNTSLTYLVCSDNQLTTLDVTKNTLLTDLYCTTNQLTNLDITKNISLKFFTCWNNRLTSLDVSKNTFLNLFYCDNNQISSLDVSKNTSLIDFACSNNQLTSLNLKNGNNINIKTDSFNLTSNPNLGCILVDDTTYSNNNWLSYKDASASYSNSCGIITIPNNNSAPIITASGNQVYCPGSSLKIVTDVSITDSDDTGTDAIYIQISSGYVNGQDNLQLANPSSHPTITTSWDLNAGKLKLFSPLGVEIPYTEFVSAIKDIVYKNSSTNPSGIRNFSISIGQANYLPSNGHYYQYVPNLGITWTNAKTAAESLNYYGLQGYLATILTVDEAKISGEQASGAGWIGGSDAETEDVWKWVTGPAIDRVVFWNGTLNGSTPNFALWNTNEPNQSGNEDYAHITAPGVGIPGSWNDLSNTGEPSGNYQPKGFIVEYGGMPNDPILQISASTTIVIPRIESTTSDSICESGNITLQAIASNGDIYWYSTETGGSPIHTGNSFTTPTISTTTSYYIDTTNGSCPNVPRTEIIATIKTLPTITSTTATSACNSGTATLVATASAGDVNWYDVSTGGTILATGNTFTTPNISATKTYYVDAIANGCKSPTRTAVIAIVNISPTVNSTTPSSVCGSGTVTLEAVPSTGNIKWYDAPTAGSFLYIGNSFTTPVIKASTTYYAEAVSNDCTSSRTPVTATVYPINTITEEVLLCQGETITLDASISGMNYLWSPGGETTQTIAVSTIGNYSVTIISPTVVSCESKKDINVTEHPKAVFSAILVNENSIKIELANNESYYEYSINGLDFQASNQFSYISSGQHTAFVRDNNECNLVAQNFTIFTIAKYFTPNYDGFNDVWEIKEMGDYPNSSARIFDRYGKLIISLTSSKYSWDGKYNNKVLPADDYWYRLKLDDTKPEITGHFTLKR